MKLQEGEEVLLELRPERKILVVWFFTNCFGLMIVGIVFGFLLFSIFSDMFEKGLEENHNV